MRKIFAGEEVLILYHCCSKSQVRKNFTNYFEHLEIYRWRTIYKWKTIYMKSVGMEHMEHPLYVENDCGVRKQQNDK